MHTIIWSPQAKKALHKLEKDVQERIMAALDRAIIRPEAHFGRLVGEKLYKLKVGDYRVIADLLHQELRILVIRVGHRKNVYER